MIICKKCKRQTEDGEPTGTFRTIVNKETKGTRIFKADIVCMNCAGLEEK